MVVFDGAAVDILARAAAQETVRFIAAEPTFRDGSPAHAPTPPPGGVEAAFLEVKPASARSALIEVRGEHYYGHPILAVRGPVTGPTVAAVLLKIRDMTGRTPRLDFTWPQRDRTSNVLWFAMFGAGRLASATRCALRHAEPDPTRRPKVHVGP